MLTLPHFDAIDVLRTWLSEVVVEVHAKHTLVNLTDNSVAVLQTSAEVVVEFVFNTCTHVQTYVILLMAV